MTDHQLLIICGGLALCAFVGSQLLESWIRELAREEIAKAGAHSEPTGKPDSEKPEKK